MVVKLGTIVVGKAGFMRSKEIWILVNDCSIAIRPSVERNEVNEEVQLWKNYRRKKRIV